MKSALLKIALFLLIAMLCIQPFATVSFAEESVTRAFHVDSLNGTRWENYICVYKGVATTKQNEWGYNIVIDEQGIVTAKIPAGDASGRDMAVPAGGMVLSGIGDPGAEMFNAVNIGDTVVFDEYAMRILTASGEINPFYALTLSFKGYNAPRTENSVVIYNTGKTTGTNSYGYEVCVDSEGYIISCGGNDSAIPRGGYVISAVGQENISLLKLWFTVGSKCEIVNKTIKVSYTVDELKKTAELELDLVKSAFEEAKAQYRIIDYAAVENALNAISTNNISTLEQRNDAIKNITNIKLLLLEQASVQTRGVWYVPEEYSVEDIKAQVNLMAEAGINELALYVDSAEGTLVPIPETIPFAVDSRTKEFDLLQTYIDACHAKNITLVVVLPVMQNSLGKNHPDWFCVDSAGNPTNEFYSPANTEYKKAFTDYLTYVLENYDVDGLQLDYIRYPEFNGSLDFGYDKTSVERFVTESGLDATVVEAIKAQLSNHPNWSVWRRFKVDLVNGWVKDCYDIVNKVRPDILMSAAVAEGGITETYCQDFAAWIGGGYIDGIYPMTYITGVNESTINKFSAPMEGNSFLVMGCGAYLSYTNEHILDETVNAAVYGTDGVGYFEWTAVVDHGYHAFFKDEMFKSSALAFTADKDLVIKALLDTAKTRINLYSGENAAEVKALAESAVANKASLLNTVEELKELLPKEDEKWLVRDYETAIRVYNLYGVEEESDNSDNSDTSDTSDNTSNEESKPVSDESNSTSDGGNGGGSTGTIIAVAVCLIGAAICAVAVVKKKKK